MKSREKLKIARTVKGMTARELGEALGYSVTNAGVRISHYETGVKNPTLNFLQKVAPILGVRVEFLKERNIDTEIDAVFALEEIKEMFGMEFINKWANSKE